MKTTLLALLALAIVAFAAGDEKLAYPSSCALPIDPGQVCSAHPPSTRYGFQADSRQCVSFTYNGCAGNINNYEDLFDCRKTCESG